MLPLVPDSMVTPPFVCNNFSLLSCTKNVNQPIKIVDMSMYFCDQQEFIVENDGKLPKILAIFPLS